MINSFPSALWTEILKMRRSKVPLFTSIGFSFVALMDGLFMVIMKDPQAARNMGLISAKAQLLAGTADWPTFFSVLTQAVAVGGAILFAVVTAWVFGREFSDHTVKELLALPTPREAIIAAKFVVIGVWTLVLIIIVFLFSLLIGSLLDIPGWSMDLVRTAFVDVMGTGLLTILLLPFVALLASVGRGYLPSFGWTILTVALAQIAAITGWGDWFPWSIPALFSGAAGPRADLLGWYSYAIVSITGMGGLIAVFYWWRTADQTR